MDGENNNYDLLINHQGSGAANAANEDNNSGNNGQGGVIRIIGDGVGQI